MQFKIVPSLAQPLTILFLIILICPLQAKAQAQIQSIQKIKKNYQNLAQSIIKDSSIHPWQKDRNSKEILQEFEALDQWRKTVWFVDPKANELLPRKPFQSAKALVKSNFFRYPNTIAFQYNHSDPSYNASTIFLKNQTFIALEAPLPNASQRFFNFLYNQKVTHVVRLTASNEHGEEKCYPYWLNETVKNKLNLAAQFSKTHRTPRKVWYFTAENWQDGAGISAEELLDLILKVKKTVTKKSLIACHCSAGVGRTGTFIAGFHLIDEIDRKLKKGITIKDLHVSVENVVKQLSIQRPYMVTKPEQYLSLYRLVDLYITKISDSSS